MLSLHRCRPALSACLLAAALAAAAHVPSAHASFGQLGGAISEYGHDAGQLEQVRAVGTRAGSGSRGAQTYVLDLVGRSIADPSDPTGPKIDVNGQRVQRFDAAGHLVGDAPLLERDEDADYSYPAEGPGTDPGYNVAGLAVDPRAAGTLMYVARQNIFDSAQGRIDAFDADTGAYVSSFPASEIRGAGNVANTIFQPERVVVDPTNGDVFVAGYKGDNNDPPLLRGFPAGGGARKVAVPLTDATPASPTQANPRVVHDSVSGLAIGDDGTPAVLSAGDYLWGTPIADDPSAGATATRFVEVFSSSGATRTRSALFPVSGSATSIAVLTGGHVVIGDGSGLTEYTAAGTPARTWGHLLAAGEDPVAGGCDLVGVPVVAAAGSDVLASSLRIGSSPVAQITRFGDGGHGCGPRADFTSGTARKGAPTTFSVVDDAALAGLADAAFAWSFSDGGSATGRSATHIFAAAGKATATLTVSKGELDSVESRTITVNGVAPTASFSVTNDNKAPGTVLAFDAGASKDADGQVVSYKWELGDGTTAAGATATHSYAAAGTYAVKLTVTDDDGATATTNKFVTVAAPAGGGGSPEPQAPAPSTPSTPGTPPTPSGPVKAQGAGTLKIAAGTLTLDAKGTLKVKLTCSAGAGPCAGRLTIVSAKAIAAAAKGKKRVLTLGSESYSVGAGKTVTVSVKVSSKALKAIKKSKRMAIKVKATGASGATTSAGGTAKAAPKAKR